MESVKWVHHVRRSLCYRFVIILDKSEGATCELIGFLLVCVRFSKAAASWREKCAMFLLLNWFGMAICWTIYRNDYLEESRSKPYLIAVSWDSYTSFSLVEQFNNVPLSAIILKMMFSDAFLWFVILKFEIKKFLTHLIRFMRLVIINERFSYLEHFKYQYSIWV